MEAGAPLHHFPQSVFGTFFDAVGQSVESVKNSELFSTGAGVWWF